jgi:hypothetical protein
MKGRMKKQREEYTEEREEGKTERERNGEIKEKTER